LEKLTKFLCNDQKVIIYQTRFIIKKYFNTENDLNFLDQLQLKCCLTHRTLTQVANYIGESKQIVYLNV